MITEEKKDFTETKRVLADLKNYVGAKIAKKNQTNLGTPVVAQEMTLASQPEVVSDHIEEESVLPPLGATTDVVNNNTIAQETSVNNSANAAQGPMVSEKPAVAATVETAAIGEQNDAVQNASSVVASSEAVKTIETPGQQAVDSSISQGETGEQSVSANGIADIGTESSNAPLSAEEAISLENVPAISIPLEQGIATGTIQNDGASVGANQNVVQAPETASNIPSLSTSVPEDLTVINAGTSANAPGENQGENIGQTTEAAVAAMVQQSETSMNTPTPQPIETAQIENIPEVSISGADLTSGNSGYQASTNGAQAVISDIMPAASDTNVVMPTGTTAEEANDQTLVVGPESFNLTR